MWKVYLPSNDLQKRELLYQVITDSMSCEDKRASHAGLTLPCHTQVCPALPCHNIIAGDTNAALVKQDVQRAKSDIKDAKHQKCIRDLHLRTTDPSTHPHGQYTFCHRTDSSQDSRIDDILISESMCTKMAPSTEVLNTSGDADHHQYRPKCHSLA